MDLISCYHECNINLQVLLRSQNLIYNTRYISDIGTHWVGLRQVSSPNKLSNNFWADRS